MPSVLRSLHLAPALLYVAGLHSNAQEPVPLDHARDIAKNLTGSVEKISKPPIHVDADVLNPFGIRAGESGALVVPDRALTAATLTQAGETPIPVGELFLRNVVVIANGAPVPVAKLQQVTVAMQDTKVELPIYFLAAARNASGALELLVYGKESEPVARALLGKVPSAAKFPIELTTEKQDENSGLLTLRIAGQYEAELLLRKPEGTQ